MAAAEDAFPSAEELAELQAESDAAWEAQSRKQDDDDRKRAVGSEYPRDGPCEFKP